MPVIRFEIAELERLLPQKVPREELAATIPLLGAEVDDWSGPTWAVEFWPNRPDLYTVEGIARALRAWYGWAPGLRRYEVHAGPHHVDVHGSVEKVRPHIAAAFVRGVPMTEERLRALIDLQEDLHWGLGARRRRVAIGIHDAKVLAPPFRYATVGPHEHAFVPLAETKTMDPHAVLTQHPKGIAYAHLLEGHARYPIILDAKDGVVSLPPVINAARTAVTAATRDVFVDVTGTDKWAVERALNMIVTALAEAGGRIEGVQIREEGGRARTTPDLSPEKKDLDVAATNKLLGLGLDAPGVAQRLARMGHGASPAGAIVHVEVPAYRADILHPRDLMEDVAIGHGIKTFEPMPLGAVTTGASLPENRLAERARMSLVGLGHLETLSLTLSNPRSQFARMRRPESPHVLVKNPATEDFTLLRVSLLPNLLEILKKNAHRDLPQKLFEVGMVSRREGDHVVQERRVAGVHVAGRSSFSDIKSTVLALARDLQWPSQVTKADDPAFVAGRCADLDGRGVFGELHPEVLANFGLGHPVTAFELRLADGPRDETRGARE